MIKTRLLSLLKDSQKYIVYVVIWQWLALLTQIVFVFSIADLLEKIYLGTFEIANLKQVIIIFCIVIVFRYICEKQKTKNSFLACCDVKHTLRERIFSKLLNLGASYKEKVPTSEVVQLSVEGVEQLETYYGKYLPQLVYSLVAPITLFVILSSISFKVSGILFLCVPLIPISIVVVQKIAKRLLNKYWSIYSELGDSFLENLQGLTTLKIYQADAEKAEEMDAESQKFRKITMKVLTMQLNSTSVMDIVAYGGAALGMVFSLHEFINGTISLGGTITIILLASEFFLPLRLLGSYFHIAMNGMAASDKIFNLLDLKETEEGTKKITSKTYNVKMENVHFRYDDSREILKGINIEIPDGSFVSLVGESGCGKSTIASLLTHENRNYQGTVTIGNLSLDEVSETDLFNHVVRVCHDGYLLKGTVEENLKMAKEDASEEEMNAVLKQVNLYEFLLTQKGLKTEIAERGSNLSGGQRQRLLIARALLKNGDVYIFDEATSNIDIESEEMIMDVIHELAKKKTVLLISHRLANVVKADQIYFMEDGMIKEKGTHEQLMSEKGSYYHLYQSQMQLEQYGLNEVKA